jgi:toxin ParE1/3/4
VRIIWLPLAQVHLGEIVHYYEALNPKAARKQIARIRASANQLIDFPQLGRLNQFKSCRLLQVSGTPYVLPYRTHGNDIEIIAVFDQRQKRPDKWQ